MDSQPPKVVTLPQNISKQVTGWAGAGLVEEAPRALCLGLHEEEEGLLGSFSVGLAHQEPGEGWGKPGSGPTSPEAPSLAWDLGEQRQ